MYWTREALDEVECPVCGRKGYLGTNDGNYKGAPLWCHRDRLDGTSYFPEPTLFGPDHRILPAEGGGWVASQPGNFDEEPNELEVWESRLGK